MLGHTICGVVGVVEAAVSGRQGVRHFAVAVQPAATPLASLVNLIVIQPDALVGEGCMVTPANCVPVLELIKGAVVLLPS